MNYHTVHDLANDPHFDLHAGILAPGFVVFGVVRLMVQRSRDRTHVAPQSRKGFTTPKVLIGLGLIIAVLGIGLMGWDQWRLLKAVSNGEGQVGEGPIQRWGTERVRTARRDNYGYKLYERFYVGDSIWFGYYRDVGQAGFRNTQDPLIDLNDGMMVRTT